MLAVLLAAGSASGLAQPTSADAYLKLFDLNGDRRISQHEYVDYMMRGFEALDVNHDGVLDADELPPSPRRHAPLSAEQRRQELTATFHRQDLDHDGMIDARELSEPPH